MIRESNFVCVCVFWTKQGELIEFNVQLYWDFELFQFLWVYNGGEEWTFS